MNKAAPSPNAPPGKAAKSDAPPAAPQGGVPIIALLVVTVLAGGLGAGFGMIIPPVPHAEVEQKHAEQLKRASGTTIIPMAPITTNLSGASRTWVRLEAAAVVRSDATDKATSLVARVSEDIVSFLRTLTIDQLEGPSGFQHLTEDLNDRARLRSEGMITELLIQSLIIE